MAQRIIARSILKNFEKSRFYGVTAQLQEQPAERRYEEIKISMPFGHLAGKMWGEPEKVPVIALHGYRDSANTFDTLAQHLKFNFLALDLPGHGLSSHAPMGTSFHWIDFVPLMRLVLKQLGFEKVCLIGHSMGSTVSVGFAGLFPDLVHKYVSIDCGRAKMLAHPKNLADTWGPVVDQTLKMEQKLMKGQIPAFSYDELLARYQKGAFSSPTLESTKILMQRGAVQKGDKFVLNYDPRIPLEAFKRPTKELLYAMLRNTKAEVLNIYGKPGFGCTQEKEYLETLEILKNHSQSPRVESYQIKGTHHLHINDPEKIAPLISDFILS